MQMAISLFQDHTNTTARKQGLLKIKFKTTIRQQHYNKTEMSIWIYIHVWFRLFFFSVFCCIFLLMAISSNNKVLWLKNTNKFCVLKKKANERREYPYRHNARNIKQIKIHTISSYFIKNVKRETIQKDQVR